MRRKIFFLLLLIFLINNVFAFTLPITNPNSATANIVIYKPTEPVQINTTFNIDATVTTSDSNTAGANYLTFDTNIEAAADPVAWNSGGARGAIFVKPTFTGKLMYVDIAYNNISSEGCRPTLDIYNYSPDGFITDTNFVSSSVKSIVASSGTDWVICRNDFTNLNATLYSDTNYAIVTNWPANQTLNRTFMYYPLDINSRTLLTRYTANAWDWTYSKAHIDKEPYINVWLFDGSTDSNITNADLNMQFNTDSNSVMAFSSGFYRYTKNGGHGQSATLPFIIYAENVTGVSDFQKAGTISFFRLLNSFLTFNPISNVGSHSLSATDNNITINPSNESQDLIFNIDSNSNYSESLTFKINNSLNDGRQYFAYTATPTQYLNSTWVFSDSLTYGTSANYDDPIQKIWDGSKYIYTFNDTLSPDENKFYKLTYRLPALYYETIEIDSDWFRQLQPDTIDLNAKTHDIYTVSNFSNIRNELIESLPQLLSSSNVAYEFQFTAFTDSNTTTFKAGLTNAAGTTDTTNDITINAIPHRYSVDINALDENMRLLLKTAETSSKTIYVTDYAIVDRGYFLNKLRVTKENNVPLDVIVSSTAGTPTSNQYLREGKIHEGRSAAYDREGDLNTLRVEVFLDTENDTNRVILKDISLNDLRSSENVLNFNETLPSIIDLNGTASYPVPFRTAKVKFTLIDTAGLEVEEQTSFFKFLQWPYYSDDIEFFIKPIEKKVAEYPSGIFNLITKDPSTILGIKLRLFNEDSSLTSPDYTKIFYKGTDFDCVGVDCGFEWKLDDFKYPDANNWTVAGTVLVNTENESTNPILHKEIIVLTTYRVFETLRVFETFERTDHAYTNTEEIGLVLQARDSDYSNLKKSLNINLNLSNCDSNVTADANCMTQTKKYLPIKFLYDASSGYNYWFFKQIFTNDNGSLLADGNHYHVYVNVTDLELKHSNGDVALLAPKCATYNSDNFVLNMLSSLNHFLFGCTATTSPIVTLTQNSNEEQYLNINTGKSTTAPTYEGLLCVSPDQNNVYTDALTQPVVCAVFYTLGENPVDSFTFEIQNENSDSSFDENEKQFIKETIPFDLIAFNDLKLMQKALEKEGNTVDTLAEFFAEGFNHLLVGTANPVLSQAQLLTNNGVITNLGFDVNLNKAFSPTNISGAFFVKFDGLKVINKYDYRGNNSILNSDAKYLRRVANIEGVNVKVEKTHMAVYASDFVKVVEKDVESPLIIDVDPTKVNQQINQKNLDSNQNTNYDFVPSLLKFDIISDLSYNNQLNTIRRFLSITIAENVKGKFNANNLISGINEFVENLLDDPYETIVSLFFGSILLISCILLLAYILSRIKRNNEGR